MRTHTALALVFIVGILLLAGCMNYMPRLVNPLSPAASMRVEVEVYKGPLSKNISVQWGELDGLVEEAADALTAFNDAIVTAASKSGYVTRRNGDAEIWPSFLLLFCGLTEIADEDLKVSIEPHYRSKKIAEQSAGKILPRTKRPEIDTRTVYEVDGVSIHDFPEEIEWCAEEEVYDNEIWLIGCHILSNMHADIRILLEELDRLQNIMQPPILSPFIEQKTYLEIAQDYAEKLHEKKLSGPVQPIIDDLSTAISKVDEILSPSNDDKSVRETAGLQDDETSLKSDIIRRIQARHEDAKNLREFKYDDLEAILSSLAKVMQSAASMLKTGGQQKKLTELIVKLDRVVEEAGQMRPALDKANIREYAKFMEKADETLRDSTCFYCRIQLDEKVKDNRGPLHALRDALANAKAHVRAVFPASRVPSKDDRKRLHVKLVDLSKLVSDMVMDRAAESPKDPRHEANQIGRPANSLFRRVRGCQKILANDAKSQNYAGSPEVIACEQRKRVMKRVGRVAIKLKAKAMYWAETHVGFAPQCRGVRIAMAAFANLASEYSNQLESLADGLQWQLGEDGKGMNARQLPLSVYLRNAETTDFLNLYTWNRAALPAIWEEMLLHPFTAFSSEETADRVRVIERLMADHNWEKINTVYGSGQGDFSMALIKDEIGNWNLKSFDSDPTELLKAYTNFAKFGLSTISSKGISLLTKFGGVLVSSKGLNMNALHKRVVKELRAIEVPEQEQCSVQCTNASDKVIERIRDVLSDYEAVIDTLQESLTPNFQ